MGGGGVALASPLRPCLSEYPDNSYEKRSGLFIIYQKGYTTCTARFIIPYRNSLYSRLNDGRNYETGCWWNYCFLIAWIWSDCLNWLCNYYLIVSNCILDEELEYQSSHCIIVLSYYQEVLKHLSGSEKKQIWKKSNNKKVKQGTIKIMDHSRSPNQPSHPHDI